MDFTEIYKQSNSLVAFSPGAHFILTAIGDRLIVRRSDTFQISRTWLVEASPSPTNLTLAASNKFRSLTFPGTDPSITHIGWSCDSEYILAACTKRGVVHILKLRDEEWSGRIDSGAEGLARAEWAPDGRTILCFSQWGLRVTVWSMVTGNAVYIQFPIYPDRGYVFRADGRYLVLAERHKSKDTIGIYDTDDGYKLVRHFPLPTSSMASLALSPTGNHLAVWEGPVEYKLYILTLAGNVLHSFTPDPDPGIGIRTVAWHPSGTFLAIAGYDDKVHILESLSWSPITTLELSTRISSGVIIWREPAGWLESTGGRGFLSFERSQGPQTIPITRSDQTKAYPKSGAIQLEWNKTGQLLMIRFESMPLAVHLYDFPAASRPFNPRLRTIILHAKPILHARWNPARKGNFVTCCSGQSLYTWSDEWVGDNDQDEEMAECIGIPAPRFEHRDFKWAPDGKGLVLLDKDQFCCAFEVEEDKGAE